MQRIYVAAGKFHDLIDYLERLGIDVDAVAKEAELVLADVTCAATDEPLSAQLYSRFYQSSVRQLQALNPTIPWAAGLGSDIFELLCHAIVSASTLGEALARAQRFSEATRTVTGHSLRIESNAGMARLHYGIEQLNVSALFNPDGWPRANTADTVAKASGLVTWHALCGWLIGHALETRQVAVGAKSIGATYQQSLQRVMGADVVFDSSENSIVFPAAALDYRVVQTKESLQKFLDEAIYQLSSIERQPASISIAIKGLIGADFAGGLPTFAEVASRLHMSESSLRRRLIGEQTSFQLIKDEVRCEAAIDYLCSSDLKINDLSELLGFAEPSSFVRSFRHWTGLTPKAYRESGVAPAAAMSAR